VAATIAGLIGGKAEGASLPGVRSSATPERFSAATYELALECRNLKNTAIEEGITRAIQCYLRVLTLDPNSAAAYAEIAYCYFLLGDPRAEAAAIKAVDLDPSLPEAHLALAELKAVNMDLSGAEMEFQQALALNPSYSLARVNYADVLVGTGRMTEAVAEATTARELDPFSAVVAEFSGKIFFFAGQYDKVIAEEKAAFDLDSNGVHRTPYWTGYAYEQKGMYKNAIAGYEKALPDDYHGIFLAALGRSFFLSGDSRRAAEVRRKIEHHSEKDFIWPYDAAMFYAALDDKDRAFEWLEKEREIHGGWLLFMRVDPRLSALRSDPRFEDLAQRVGLPTPPER
jgi:tetratricopeptide (TPR) repeat protein